MPVLGSFVPRSDKRLPAWPTLQLPARIHHAGTGESFRLHERVLSGLRRSYFTILPFQKLDVRPCRGRFFFVSRCTGNDSTAIGLNPVGAESCLMPRSDRSPSIGPPGNDRTLILCSTISAAGSGRLGARNNFPPPILVLKRGTAWDISSW